MGIVFRSKNQELSERAVEVLTAERPMTLRQLYYRLISAGVLRNDQKEYKRLGQVMTRLRETGNVPRTWIVDHVRSTLKPSSWTGLADFADSVRECYRKDFWSGLDHHVEVFVEKDAVAGTVQPITAEYDVALRVCRGYSSVSFAGEIADLWTKIEKPIFAYYIGDFDPSGFDLERDLREKLQRYRANKKSVFHSQMDGWAWLDDAFDKRELWGHLAGLTDVFWFRLAVRHADFEDHDLIRLPVKHSDNRSKGFTQRYGDDCAEVDALPPSELRQRVEQAITSHIDADRWSKLLEVEKLEQQTVAKSMAKWTNGRK
jgi:hypothetical protein